MKPRYNLRIQPTKLILSTTNKKTASKVTKKSKLRHSEPVITEQTRRHSLRLTPTVKKTKPSLSINVPKWRKVENEHEDENASITNTHDDDDYDALLVRHHRLMLEERKDRKLYERYIRDQRILRRMQCRRTHTAHLSESKRNRLLRELERERRYEVHDKICTYLANRTIIFRHSHHKESRGAMNWSSLEEEVPHNRNIGTIHELDVMIGNLKKAMRNSKSPLSKPRLSVRERQHQRLTTLTPVKADVAHILDLHSSPILIHAMEDKNIREDKKRPNSTSQRMNPPSPLSIISYSPRVPLVRFTDDPNLKLRTSNSQRLTCIQNVLSHQSRNTTNEISTPVGIRKSFLRPKSPHTNSSESLASPTKKRALEKENCSVLPNSSSNNTHSDILLRTTSPMVSIKHTSSSSSSRTYPNTRKHSIINPSLTTRRYTRLSANG